MSYRLQNGESLADGLKRVADEQLAGAIEQLQASNVYEVRRRIKKLRAILRLVKPYLGPAYVEENRRLRDLAHRFASLRDLDVCLEGLDTFAVHYKRKGALDPLRKHLDEKRKQVGGLHKDLEEAVAALYATRRRIEDWPLLHVTAAGLDARRDKSHKRGRHAFHLAIKTRHAEDFHELRKSVKHELNQTRLLEGDTARSETLKKLSTLLGDHHNLIVLLNHLESASGRFRALTHRRLRKLESEILALGSKFYSHHPASQTVAAVA